MRQMRNLKISGTRSNSRIKSDCPREILCTSTSILYHGMKRKMDKSQYIKRPAKLKLQSTHASRRVSETTKRKFTEEDFIKEFETLKADQHSLRKQNQQLRKNIMRETKLAEICGRRLGDCNLADLPYEKLIEVKLIIETSELQKKLSEKERELSDIQKQMKASKHSLVEDLPSSLWFSLLNLVLGDNKDIQANKKCLKAKIKSIDEQLDSLITKKSRINAVIARHREKLSSLQQEINQFGTQSTQLQFKQNSTSDDRRSASLVNRTKNIEELQSEIDELQREFNRLSFLMQEQMDEKISTKLMLHNQINKQRQKLMQISLD